MSKDIRSYFNVISKKSKNVTTSNDDDFIEASPTKTASKSKGKKRKMQIIESDSEDDNTQKDKKKKPEKPSNSKVSNKSVSAAEIFGTLPVQQTKIEVAKTPILTDPKLNTETELNIHSDPDFEKSLLELDEDFLMENMKIIDKVVDNSINDKRTNPSKAPKRKLSVNDNSDTDKDQERYEKRRYSALLYQKYRNRSGPAHHGAKEYPKGNPDCFKNLCFLRTGVLDSLECEEFESLVKEHGGRTVKAISKKVNYLVVGEDAGPAKMQKAKDYGIRTLSENEFLDLILTRSGMLPRYCSKDTNTLPDETGPNFDDKLNADDQKKDVEQEIKEAKIDEEKNCNEKDTESVKSSNVNEINSKILHDNDKTETITSNKISLDKDTNKTKVLKSIKGVTDFTQSLELNSKPMKKHETNTKCKNVEKIIQNVGVEGKMIKLGKETETLTSSLSWTEKYKPTDIKDIIGQQTEKSNMKKLFTWLQNWYKNHGRADKPKHVKPSPWAKDDNGAFFKCALLSGSPGVGKTTTATLVARELGYDIVEFNASDTRNKKSLSQEVAQLLNTSSIATFFKDGSPPTKKHVLLMDEVDGMSGNEDRGGMQELITLIKNAKVPVICMCNDRNHQKIRSLANYCFDLRFSKPRMEQIRGAMMSICFKEGLNIRPDILTQIINDCEMDIRQVLNNLSMWSVNDKTLSAVTKESLTAKKDIVLGPWEVVRKVFSEEEHKKMSLIDKSSLFFYDYSLGPLFIQENYLHAVPHCHKNELLDRVAKTADSISTADIIEKKIRSSNNWSLLEVQAMYASVLPGQYMEGHMGGQINFPIWLGNNSKRNKFHRLLSELQAHMRTSVSASRSDVNLDYLYLLRDGILQPLIKNGADGVKIALKFMHSYHLLREDLDNLVELCHWSRSKDYMKMIDSKVKASFTRSYNKDNFKLPYAVVSSAVKKKAHNVVLEGDDDMENEDDENDLQLEDDDVTNDAMIKAATKKKPTPAATTSRGRGKKTK